MHEPIAIAVEPLADTALSQSRAIENRRPVRVQLDVFERLQSTQRGQRVQFDLGFIATAALRMLYAHFGDESDGLILNRARDDYFAQEKPESARRHQG
jgi:hypothetical protein